MALQNLHFLAIPLPRSFSPHKLGNLKKGEILCYRRNHRRRNIVLTTRLDSKGKPIPVNRMPRHIRKLSRRGVFDGYYGWPRSRYIHGFIDWTIYGTVYGLSSDHHNTRSDTFIITRDFIVHGQHDRAGTPILPKIKNTRYGAPLYNLDTAAQFLPVYLRTPSMPPSSAHERIRNIDRYGQQLQTAMNLLQISDFAQPEMTWLSAENYGSRA